MFAFLEGVYFIEEEEEEEDKSGQLQLAHHFLL